MSGRGLLGGADVNARDKLVGKTPRFGTAPVFLSPGIPSFPSGHRKRMGDDMTDTSAVFRFLLDNRVCPDDIPGHMDAGICAILAGSPRRLSGVVLPQDGLLDTGRSGNPAGRNHFRMESSGFGSPGRSLGALPKSGLQLAAEPRSAGRSPVNHGNCRFGGEGETRSSKWMKQDPICAIRPLDSDVQGMENSSSGSANRPSTRLAGVTRGSG